MKKSSKFGCLVVLFLMVGSLLYGIYQYKTTHYDILEDYPVILGTGTTYYVDSLIGSDLNTGISPENAWFTVDKVNNFTFSAGDSILFVRNGTWRERIIPQGGSKDGWLYYGAYGSGNKPLFIGSILLNISENWVSIENGTWMWTVPLVEDAGNLIFNHENSVGVKKWTLGDMQIQGDFYFEKTNKTLYLKSGTNPGNYYSEIECALGQHMLYKPHPTYAHIGVHTISNVVFENLAFRYGGAYAFKFQNVDHIQILNCEISWMGGAEVDGQPNTRYGNGIEFFGKAFYCIAAGNIMTEIYDSGVSYQAINTPAAGIGLNFTNNTMSKCAYAGLELWLHAEKGEITNFTFVNNTLLDIGYGWGSNALQRKVSAYWGFGYLLDFTPSPTSQITITGNLVNHTSGAVFVRSSTFNGFNDIIIDYNQYMGSASDLIYAEFGLGNMGPVITTQYSFAEISTYKTQTGKDKHSIIKIG